MTFTPPVALSDEEIASVRSWVIHEDAHVIAFNKPAGLSSQGGRIKAHTLDDLLWAFARSNGKRPDLVHRLVLVEPVLFAAAAGDPAFDSICASNRLLPELIGAGRREEAAAAFYADWGGGGDFASLPAALRAYMTARIATIPAQNGVLIEDRAGMLAAGRLERLGAPVLLVEGAQSPPVVAAIQRGLARRLPDARREVIAGAAHMLPVTHAGALAPLVAAHLA